MGLALVASGCESSSRNKADPTADLNVAKAAVLTKADLPAGFDGTTPDSSSYDIPAAAKLEFANCLNAKLSLFDDRPGEQKATSDTFSQDDIQIDNEVDVYAKKSDVTDNYKLMTKKETPGCLEKLFTIAIQSALTPSSDTTGASTAPQFGTLTVTKLNVSGVGDRVVGFRTAVPVTAAGQTTSEYVDVLAAAKGRALVTLTSYNTGTPYNQATETQLLSKVVTRLGNQVG